MVAEADKLELPTDSLTEVPENANTVKRGAKENHK